MGFFRKSLSDAKYPVIMIASAAAMVILIISVAEGLDGQLVSKIIGVSSHVEITTSDGFGFSGYEEFIEKIKREQGELISGITPRFSMDAIISKDEYSTGIRLIGADFTSESSVSSFFPLRDHINLVSSAANDGNTDSLTNEVKAAGFPVLITGRALYDKFKLTSMSRLKITTINSEAFFISPATFEIGIYDYDYSYCYCEIKTLQKLAGCEQIATSILIKLKDISKASEFAERLKKSLHDDTIIVRTYEQINKSLFATIKLERLALFFIIFLSLALANMAVAFVISQNVHRRAKTIAIMNALGAKINSVTMVFFYEGLIYGVIGLLIGACSGIAGGLALDWFSLKVPGEITLYYSIKYLPVSFSAFNIIAVCFIELFVLLISSMAAARKALKTDVIQALRNS